MRLKGHAKLERILEGYFLKTIEKNDITFAISGDFSPCCRIKLLYKNTPVGYCNLVKDEDTVKLADFFVYCRKKPIAWFLPFIKVGTNYRRHGFGTLLLEKVIKLCLEIKVSKIVGQAQGELEILIPWYRKHNFDVDVDNNLLLDLSVLHDNEIKNNSME